MADGDGAADVWHGARPVFSDVLEERIDEVVGTVDLRALLRLLLGLALGREQLQVGLAQIHTLYVLERVDLHSRQLDYISVARRSP